jgi:hypothetical protein
LLLVRDDARVGLRLGLGLLLRGRLGLLLRRLGRLRRLWLRGRLAGLARPASLAAGRRQRHEHALSALGTRAGLGLGQRPANERGQVQRER